VNSNDIYQRKGWWWTTMGFTKTHMLGVFIVEALLGMGGLAVVYCALTNVYENMQACLLVAICLFLLQLSVLLTSILSLLFYLGAPREPATNESDRTAARPTQGPARPSGAPKN
jgi:hypothetical protein